VTADIRTFDQISAGDVEIVGGKGLSLGLMAAARLPVPPGFCITADAHRRDRVPGLSSALRQTIIEEYRRLGGGLVAVRSSATAEDGAAASFAGQQETILGVSGEAEVCGAVAKCWASLDSERAKAYRAKQGVGEMAMAVVVQSLVPAEVAGVLFTHDPLAPQSDRMVVEASYGLGESVVSGRVTPDRFVISRDSGQVLERHLGRKTLERTAEGEREVSAGRQSQFCLNDEQLARLAELGRRVEEFYRQPRDVEWAWAGGQFWLLQARPITTADSADREKIRREEIESLRAKADPNGTVWGRFNLSEVLPEPTPMTWAIVRRFLSGSGGYGKMFEDLGFPPDPSLADECGYDLVCGRPYMNLSREPRMQWGDLPVRHIFAELKANPSAVPYSIANFRTEGASFTQKVRMIWRSIRGGARYQAQSRTFAEKFRAQTIPEFVAETTAASHEDWSRLDAAALLKKLDHWIQRSLVAFARDSLKPTAFAAGSIATLLRMLDDRLGPERARMAISELTAGVRPDADADLPGALADVAASRIDRTAFVDKFGQRGSREMELSEPRWYEDAATLDRVMASAGAASHHQPPEDTVNRIVRDAKLTISQSNMLRAELDKLRTALALRETGKHHLLRGYALIRRALLELDRRHELGGGIFFLTPDELPALLFGDNLAPKIAERRKRRSIVLSLEVPPALFSDDLDAIGRPQPPPAGATTFKGVPLSAGVAEGPAMVLTDPHAAAPAMDNYILVCPSTDPSWVPLFARAKGLVMETGGVLSHGAIVAREFGLPAVAGLPEVTRSLHTGQKVRVDGNSGIVVLV
jgi:rifampicin phosphotransferase